LQHFQLIAGRRLCVFCSVNFPFARIDRTFTRLRRSLAQMGSIFA